MCGIVGYAGSARALPVLVEGIRHLSYRGYDSAGVALQENGSLRVEKDKGRIGDLAPLWERQGLMGITGVGHTRWATHGPPNQVNAHPQADATNEVAVVHNGILENDLALREELERGGVKFTSQTDTEVFAHLFARVFRDALARTPSAPSEAALAAARALFERCKGHFALAILHARLPATVVGLRRGSPLLVGLGVGENLVASDVKALSGRVDRVVEMGEDEIAIVTRDGVRLFDAAGRPVERAARRLDEREQDVGKDGHPHYMLKEIHEQPERTYELLAGRIDTLHGTLRPDEVRLSDAEWQAVTRIDLVASGTAHIASLYGAYVLEALARIPCRAIVAAEYEARSPVLGPDVLVVAVTQSGETADTKGALELATRQGARTLGVLNVRESAIGRAVKGLVDIHAGPEISVASTKVYTGMLSALLLLALRAASARGRGAAPLAELTPWFRRLPDLMRTTISRVEAVREVAREIHRAENMLFLGRGADAATALEGALKMKELSYIHAEGYPAGEMKHGPIALVSWDVPTVAIATPGPWRDRMLGNVREVKARDGLVILVAADGDGDAEKVADFVLRVPEAHPWIAPIVNVLPLQLLAYETAKRRGCDIDQPRNLAKTVTVQ
jgi:glutamine---fructose-6-phosphate transaminase (isomerizing)